MLANEGYAVLELAYNMPQYGQPDIYHRGSFPIEYIEAAIERLLRHDAIYGDEVCLVGHSKGGDLSLAASAVLKRQIALTISNSCHINAPVFADTTYRQKRFKSIGLGPQDMKPISNRGDDGLWRLHSGMWTTCAQHNGESLYERDQLGEFQLKKDIAKRISLSGIPYSQGRNIHHFHTICDPIIGPSRDCAIEYANMLFGQLLLLLQSRIIIINNRILKKVLILRRC